ncbi:MAG: GTP pyrophosphokinase, partial [Muribaculaceae bacterium]|nr:GTP pyrophosphokinase [Muribaculaceae bacterium]
TKEVYELRTDPDTGKPNYRIDNCCNPLPGDDVMGFIDDSGNVIVHALTCPRAQVLKAGYGPRIVAVRWGNSGELFTARVHIEGVDRFGMLQELIALISNHMGIEIRKLNIEADNEVFGCDLWVRVTDASVVDSLVTKIATIKGITNAARIK